METGIRVAAVAPSADGVGGSWCKISTLGAAQLGFQGRGLSASRFELVSRPLCLVISIPFLYFQVSLFTVVIQM